MPIAVQTIVAVRATRRIDVATSEYQPSLLTDVSLAGKKRRQVIYFTGNKTMSRVLEVYRIYGLFCCGSSNCRYVKMCPVICAN